MNWRSPQIVVRAAQPSCIAEANRLAQLTGLAFCELTETPAPEPNEDSSPWTLLVKPTDLSLIRPDGLYIEIDFIHGRGTRRSREANFHSQPLARALNLRKLRQRTDQKPTLIDATAGFGTDGWMMASLGCKVRLLEASPVLAAMLTQALTNARCGAPKNTSNHARDKQYEHSPAHNISVINTNSVQFLHNHENAGADIIYLDPMYPQTRNKALVKKGMQLLHDLIGPDTNGAQLLCAALKRAEYRVVVKRPRGTPPLEGTTNFTGQTSTVKSTNTRYDIYHIRHSSSPSKI